MMSSDKLPEGFSLRIGGSVMLSPEDAFLNSAHGLVFPFLLLRMHPDAGQEDSSFDVRVNPKVYDFFKSSLLTDELAIVAPLNGVFVLWTSDMVISMKLLSALGITSDLKEWILSSRTSMANLFSSEKVQAIRKNEKALKITEEILTTLGILEVVKSNELLSATVKDVIETQQMDPDTIIYRLGLAIYHSRLKTGNSIIPALDESSGLYLKLSQSKLYEKYKEHFSIIMDLPPDARIKTVRILIAFIIASYVYYKKTSGD